MTRKTHRLVRGPGGFTIPRKVMCENQVFFQGVVAHVTISLQSHKCTCLPDRTTYTHHTQVCSCTFRSCPAQVPASGPHNPYRPSTCIFDSLDSSGAVFLCHLLTKHPPTYTCAIFLFLDAPRFFSNPELNVKTVCGLTQPDTPQPPLDLAHL